MAQPIKESNNSIEVVMPVVPLEMTFLPKKVLVTILLKDILEQAMPIIGPYLHEKDHVTIGVEVLEGSADIVIAVQTQQVH
jgi:hypothetical protein